MPISAVIHYNGNSNPHIQYTLKASDGSTSILEEVQNECDFGITYDSLLSFKEHIAHIVNKANSFISLIKQSLQHMDEKMFLHLYKTFILPIVPTTEYGNVIRCLHLKKDIVANEKV